MKPLFLIVLLLSLAGHALTQHNPVNDFIPPLDVPLKLSGTFGELRSDHFHSGIDLKTGEMEGLKVYSIGDGYISRIKVQSGGYGKALYITHPNGYVSVYAHLSRYNGAIDDYVTETQYGKRSYELDVYPPKELFPVSQGDVIAFSGNSGRSGGPHLHFEIRGESNQKPVNPLNFNFKVTDNTAPLINMVKVYPSGKQSRVENTTTAKDFYAVSSGTAYSLKGPDTIASSGTVQFGINTHDPFYGGINKNGVYSIRLFVDDEPVYGHKLESFSFDETRYINSLIDYKEYKTQNRRVQKSFVDPNNKLGIYTIKNRHGLNVEAGKIYQVKYEVSDFAGNIATLIFWIRGVKGPSVPEVSFPKGDTNLFTYQNNNTFTTDDLELMVPGDALYDTLTFVYSKQPSPKGALSAVHRLHSDHVPLHTWCPLAIVPDNPDDLPAEKILLVKLERDGELTSLGGEIKDGRLTGRIREFGDYTLMIDTMPPQIKPVNIYPNKSLLAQNTIQVKITDELSGIATYNGYLDDRWILMEYDEKNDLLTYYFDQNLEDGENVFMLVVTDERNNTAQYKIALTY